MQSEAEWRRDAGQNGFKRWMSTTYKPIQKTNKIDKPANTQPELTQRKTPQSELTRHWHAQLEMPHNDTADTSRPGPAETDNLADIKHVRTDEFEIGFSQ